MKIFKLLTTLLIICLISVSCVNDDDFFTPTINFNGPSITTNTTIENVNAMFGGYEPVLIAAGDASSTELWLEGYVVSSDESGNFYKTLVIQDSPENPKAGVSISIEATDTYTFFEPGRKVYVRVDGLFIGEYGGLPTIGLQGDDGIERMSVEEFEERVLRTDETVELVPTVITIDQISDGLLNTLVQFQNVQFSSLELGNAYGNLNNTYTVNRIVENCEGDYQVVLRNSGYSDFKNISLPEGNGTLNAILSVYNSDYQIFIREPSDVNFSGSRCEALYEETFEDINTTGNGAYIDLEGWTNVNVNGGDERFEARSYNGNTYAQISAYGTGENPMEAWLVTSGIDLSVVEGTPQLSFLTIDAYNNGEALTAYISTDFTGDVTNATWTQLPAKISTGTSSGYASSFTSSGNLDLSAYAGKTIYLGFRYLGGSITTTYEIDNIKLSSN